MGSRVTDVFLSYKAEDRARVTPLVEALEAEGFTVWWDARIGGGTNWQEEIEQHLDSARCVLVAWSKRSIGHDGQFVRDEARRAQRRGAYLPVRLDSVEPPLGFGEIQALTLKAWKGDRSDARFQAVASAVRSRISGDEASRAHAHFHQPGLARRAAIAGGVGVAAIAIGGGGWLLLRPSPANSKRIAVMPFANLSGDAGQAYFSEGVAEELRSALSRIGLQVIGRASSDAVKDLDTKTAAAKLGVANVLTGSVRRSPETIRIDAQLIGGSDGVERWTESYDRAPGDAIKIQTDIATNVAQALSVALGQAARAALTVGGTADAKAQDLYLLAEDRFNKDPSADSIRQTIDLLDAAVGRDPNYANAYRLKGWMLEWQAGYATNPAHRADKLAGAEVAARRAIQIAPNLGSAYTGLALIEGDRLNFADALQYNARAQALSPEDPTVLLQASRFAEIFGDPNEALELSDRVISLDPIHAISYGRRASILFTLRRYSESIEASRKAIEFAPQAYLGHLAIGNCLALMNEPAGAAAEYRQAPPDDLGRLTGEAIVAARSRDWAATDRSLARIRKLFGVSASYQYAQIYAGAANADRAFAELGNALEAKDPELKELSTDPFLDPIRGDRRYAALLKRLHFP